MTTTLTGRSDHLGSTVTRPVARDRSSALSPASGVAHSSDGDPRLRAFLDRLRHLDGLPGDWNPGAPPPSGDALAFASDIVQGLRRLGARSIPDVSPTNSGGVLLEWRSAPSFRAAVEVTPSGRIVFFADDPSGIDVEGELPGDPAPFVEALRTIARFSE